MPQTKTPPLRWGLRASDYGARLSSSVFVAPSDRENLTLLPLPATRPRPFHTGCEAVEEINDPGEVTSGRSRGGRGAGLTLPPAPSVGMVSEGIGSLSDTVWGDRHSTGTGGSSVKGSFVLWFLGG